MAASSPCENPGKARLFPPMAAIKKPGVAAGLSVSHQTALSSRRLQIARGLLATLGDDFE